MPTILSHFEFDIDSGLISRFFMLYYSYLSSNVSYARPIPLGHSSRVCDISCCLSKLVVLGKEGTYQASLSPWYFI